MASQGRYWVGDGGSGFRSGLLICFLLDTTRTHTKEAYKVNRSGTANEDTIIGIYKKSSVPFRVAVTM